MATTPISNGDEWVASFAFVDEDDVIEAPKPEVIDESDEFVSEHLVNPFDNFTPESGIVVKKYSEVYGWDATVLAGKDDYDVVTYENKYWNKADLAAIPKREAFAHYWPNHAVMYDLVRTLQPQFSGSTVMTVGPTGCGKTSMYQYIAMCHNQPVLRINGRQDMESDAIIGKNWLEPDGSMSFRLGSWPTASQKGHMVIWDEPWKTPPGIMMTLQPVLERGGVWHIEDLPGDKITDKQIVPKSSYRCVMADNVVGTGDGVDKYAATMLQDSSSLNRIDYVHYVPYSPVEVEVKIVTEAYPAIPEAMAVRMIALLNLLRSGFDSDELSVAVSLRNVFAWADFAVDARSYEQGFKQAIFNRYAEDSERGAVENHYKTCFNREL